MQMRHRIAGPGLEASPMRTPLSPYRAEVWPVRAGHGAILATWVTPAAAISLVASARTCGRLGGRGLAVSPPSPPGRLVAGSSASAAAWGAAAAAGAEPAKSPSSICSSGCLTSGSASSQLLPNLLADAAAGQVLHGQVISHHRRLLCLLCLICLLCLLLLDLRGCSVLPLPRPGPLPPLSPRPPPRRGRLLGRLRRLVLICLCGCSVQLRQAASCWRRRAGWPTS